MCTSIRSYKPNQGEALSRWTPRSREYDTPASAPPDALDTIWRRLDELAEQLSGSREMPLQLASMFLGKAPDWLAELTTAWQQGSLETAAQAAHTLKGAATNVGADALAKLCADLEAEARAGRTERIPALVNQVHTEFEQVRQALQVILDS